MSKYFIITVDTEGEGGWSWHRGDKIYTRNADYVEPFQKLCDKFCFKPVYLTNYEMAMNDEFMNRITQWEKDGRCEIGIHLHAWSNPPFVELNGPYDGQDYLIEYPENVMREKFAVLYNLLTQKIGHAPVSHRAGRWAMDDRYFKILSDFGIKVDCSYTPGINWSLNKGITRGGSDFSSVPDCSHWIEDILEVPMTIRQMRTIAGQSLKQRIKNFMFRKRVWLRPAGQSSDEMKRLISKINSEDSVDYVEFMIHSSELMPGGSPYFTTESDINKLLRSFRSVFDYASRIGYQGVTLQQYYDNKKRCL